MEKYNDKHNKGSNQEPDLEETEVIDAKRETAVKARQDLVKSVREKLFKPVKDRN